jgi:lipopolysaccharide export system protein LptA
MRLSVAVHREKVGLPVMALVILMALFFPSSGLAQAPKKLNIDKNQPIQIQSDRLDAYQEKRTVVFSGNALATQGDKTIRADRLILHYKNQPGGSTKKDVKDMGAIGDLDRIEAQGHVTITQTNRVVTGDSASFHQDSQKVVMTGNAVMREGKNVIKGDRIVVFLNEERGVVEGNENKRVTATIYPNEKKEEKPK